MSFAFKRTNNVGRIIALVNQKGGVGKTTTSINLAASFAVMKRKVLLIDMDAQGNATVGSGVNKDDLAASTRDVLLHAARVEDAAVRTEGNYDLLGTDHELVGVDVELMQLPNREARLKQALASVVDKYDYILIDCPPSLSMLTVNALVAAHSVLIPIQCEYFALEGLKGLLNTIEQIQASVNPQLTIEGLLRTMYDGRNRLALDVSEQLLQHFPTRVYNTVIPRNVRLAEAPSHGMPIVLYDEKSQGAVAYLTLAGEMLRRLEEAQAANASNQAVEV
jgi:chromosome partitioning protein